MAFKRTFIIVNVLMILIGLFLILNVKAGITGAVVGGLGLSASRSTFFGLVFVFMGILLFMLEAQPHINSENKHE